MRALLLAACALALPLSAQEQRFVVRAERVYTGTGAVHEGGFVAVAGGKIAATGPGAGGAGDQLECFAVTPGLIDLGAHLVSDPDAVEQSSETVFSLRVADALDLFSPRWERELRSGVTTVLATPPDRDVIGGLCVAVKTGGAPELAARLVKADAALRGSFGTEPSQGNQQASGPPQSFYVRRPTTRMGVEWSFRSSFYEALAARRDASKRFEGVEVLWKVLDGELPLCVQANLTQDVRTAIYLKEEFGIERMFVDAASEAWREPELLVRSGMGVVLPPFTFRGRTGRDNGFFAWNTAAMLHELGVPFALSGDGARDVAERLSRQPGLAMRGGLPFDAALAAVTITPARMIGIDARVGSIEVGKDADLVLWSGEPFQPTSRVVGVLLDGRLVVDPRPGRE